MPKGRQEKFTTHTDPHGVTLVRKDSKAGKMLETEKQEFAKAAPEALGKTSGKFRKQIIDDAANQQVVKHIRSQVTPGPWVTKSKIGN